MREKERPADLPTHKRVEAMNKQEYNSFLKKR